MNTNNCISVAGIRYAYPGSPNPVLAISQLDFHLGRINILLGENGAGKSTLAKLLAGRLNPQQGNLPPHASLYLPQHIISYADTRLWEFLWLMFTQGQRYRWRSSGQRKAELISALGEHIDSETLQQTFSEYVSQVSSNILHLWCALLLLSRRDNRFMVFDEPTAVLSQTESQLFYQAARIAAKRGVCILVITHRLKEAISHADHIAVLRRGVVTAQLSDTQNLSLESVQQYMFEGERNFESNSGNRVIHQHPQPRFELKGISCQFSDLRELDDISMDISAGEILAVSGIRDEGLTQLEELVSARVKSYTGSAWLNGRELHLNDMPHMRHMGVSIVPSQRKIHGVALDLPAWESAGVGMRKQISMEDMLFGRRKFRRTVIQRFRSVDLDLRKSPASYSGGMIQRLIVHREIYGHSRDNNPPALLILSNPSWGLDTLQRQKIYQLIRSAANNGSAVLLLTGELDEALELADRIVFIHGGRLNVPDPERCHQREYLEACFLGQHRRQT